MVTFVVMLVFMQPASHADGAMKIEDPIRPGTTRAFHHLQTSPAAPVSTHEQAERGSADPDHVLTPPVHSAQICTLSDINRHDLKTRFYGHRVADESRDGRAFNPCTPARAGPSL